MIVSKMNYSHWIAHFEANRLDRPESDWNAPFAMPEAKRQLLAKSLSEYQMGDGGGECRLVAADTDPLPGGDATRYAHIPQSTMNVPAPRTIKSSAEWVDYFQANASQQKEIPWEESTNLSADELAAIIPSLRGWQLGETSDGSHLLAAARTYAADIGDPTFIEAVRLFIAEEQRHGGNLGRFLDCAGVTRATSDWGDTLFRAVRYLIPHMEIWATPVVMVETHALIYYNAIRKATRSAILQRICEQILADEVAHIRFQCERLAILHRGRPDWLRSLTMLFHRGFFALITLAVWVGHRHALREGGYRFKRFWRVAWSKMGKAWSLMNPQAYSWK